MPGESKSHGIGRHAHETQKSQRQTRPLTSANKGQRPQSRSTKSAPPPRTQREQVKLKSQQKPKREEPPKRQEPEIPPEEVAEVPKDETPQPEDNEHNHSTENEVPETPEPQTERWAEPSPKGFVMETFNSNINDFTELFCLEKYNKVGDEYPVEELISVVASVTTTVQEFKEQTAASQRQLEGMREKMSVIKENIHFSMTQRAREIDNDDENQTVEQRELALKLALLNEEVAKANAELADALRLSAETETTVVNAQLAAERAKEEALRIQEEIELRARLEEKRKQQEIRRMEEAKRQKEAEERRAEEARREKEAEWRRKEAGAEHAPAWETWPTYEFKVESGVSDFPIGCVIRGHPAKFDDKNIQMDVISQLDCCVAYAPQEELGSCIVKLSGKSDNYELQEPIYLALPYVTARTVGHVQREPVIKGQIDGQWKEFLTHDVTLDNHKEQKFAQAEVNRLTTFVVMTRFKRDYMTLTKKPTKVAASYDHRLTINVPKDTFINEHLLLQVQPVDSGIVNDLRHRSPNCKALLTASPIVHTQWESAEFRGPLTITLPCPPNPAKAKKMAAMRAMKEAQMRTPLRHIPPPIDEKERERERKKQQQEEEVEEKKQTKWYMGEYAHNDDDENDSLFLVCRSSGGKWSVVPEIKIMQVKLDVVQFELDRPLDTFCVLRTRPAIEDATVVPMASDLEEILSQRFVHVVLKQKNDDLFDSRLSIIPANRVDKAIKKLAAKGYDDGPDASNVVSVNEGDIIAISFRGNIKKADVNNNNTKLVFNSNVKSEVGFYVSEVDRYLQKSFSVYRGVVQVYRCYNVSRPDKQRAMLKRQSSVDDMAPSVDLKRQLICEIPINIPKYHIEPDTTPVKAPITLVNTHDPVTDNLMRHLAIAMGEEWRKVAHYLNVSRVRVQAIHRNMLIGEVAEEDARYEMLMSWLKKMPKATDKVSILSSALIKCGRPDLADGLRRKEREYKEQQRTRD